jgi:hypothetical protein
MHSHTTYTKNAQICTALIFCYMNPKVSIRMVERLINNRHMVKKLYQLIHIKQT